MNHHLSSIYLKEPVPPLDLGHYVTILSSLLELELSFKLITKLQRLQPRASETEQKFNDNQQILRPTLLDS